MEKLGTFHRAISKTSKLKDYKGVNGGKKRGYEQVHSTGGASFQKLIGRKHGTSVITENGF